MGSPNFYTSVSELHSKVLSGETTFEKETLKYLENIEKHNTELNAYITLMRDEALDQAKRADEKVIQKEKLQPLEGVPFSIKDMFCTKGVKTTAGSRMLETFVPPYDATVIEKLRQNGAIFLGKTNLDEFAMGSTNENSYFGPAKNPWNKNKVPGGSSGGSAVSIASRQALCSLGTDTGGSVRQPAHFCGVVGLKPTYGRISRYGAVAFASSLDQTGVFSLKVEDAFRTVQVLSGKDPKDNTTSSKEVPNWIEEVKSLKGKSLTGKKIGLVKEYMESNLDSDVREVLDESISYLKSLGAEMIEVSLPAVKHGVSAYYLIATSEAASNLSRYDGVRYGHRSKEADAGKLSLEEFYTKNRTEGFGNEVKRRILLGNFSLSSGYYEAYYKKACQIRNVIKQEYMKAFSKVDCILAPVAVSTAFEFKVTIKDPVKKFLNDYFTVTANLAGLPGLTVPVQKNSEGLPCGVQLVANQFNESELLQIGLALESKFEFFKEVPNG